MADVVLNGNNYRTGTMSAMEQFHVVRRLLPVVSSLGDIPVDPVTKQPSMAGFMQAMVTAIAKLSDDDCEFVISHCLRVCRRQEGQLWAPVWNLTANRIQYDDIDLVGMINLTTATLGENLQSFFPALPSLSLGENSQQSDPYHSSI